MTLWVETAGDIASASTALGGLLLVFIGSITTGFGSYTAEQQSAVRRGFLVRGVVALLGFALSLAAAVLALVGKLTAQSCPVIASVWCLGFAFALVVVAAIVSVMDLLN